MVQQQSSPEPEKGGLSSGRRDAVSPLDQRQSVEGPREVQEAGNPLLRMKTPLKSNHKTLLLICKKPGYNDIQ